MQKYIKWIVLAIVIIAIAIAGYFLFFNNNNKPQTPSSDASRLSTEVNMQNENSTLEPTTPPTETEIAKFSTKIIDEDDDRDTNMKITASKLNDTIVKDGEEFSFNEIAGNPTPDEGYKKAHVFIDGKMAEGYGGGNCQVSSTLYNAVQKVNGLKVTERHGHDLEVGYIELGKDATVAYDDLDFKFKNNAGYDIKIYTEITEKEVIVKLMKLSV